jgi:hypothetical protein
MKIYAGIDLHSNNSALLVRGGGIKRRTPWDTA